MRNRQDQARSSGKDKRGEEEVRLKIKVSNEGEAPESFEDLTDDEVFKELINIVVDVFSHKSEKCLLTFELPSQSDGLATVSSDSLCASASDCLDQKMDDKLPISDILIPIKSFESIPSRKSSKHERNLKLPINKPSKQNNKKIFDKRLNPIVQTVLHAKQGFTDLETLFNLRHRSACRGRWQQRTGNERQRSIEVPGELNSIENEWEREKDVHNPTIWDHGIELGDEPNVKHIFPPTCSAEDFGDSNRRSNLYNQFHEIIDTLRMLMNTYDENSHPDLHRIEYHIAEIKAHISAITSYYLFSGSSNLSSSGEVNDVMPYPKTEKVGTLISRTRNRGQDVTLYRVATKKSFTSRSHLCRRRNRNNYRSIKASKTKQVHPKKRDETEMSLEGVLHCYQRVKREEKELVKILLSRLGLGNVERERSHSQKHREHLKDSRVSGRYCQTSGRPYERERETIQISRTPNNYRLKDPEYNEIPQKHKASVDKEISMEYLSTVKAPSKTLKRNIRAKRRLLTKSLETNEELQDDRINYRKRHTKCTIPTSSIQEKREETSIINEADVNALLNSSFATKDTIVKSQDDRCALPFKEEKVMSRIQNAAERLEHMQDLVEKKLGYLCKQKEFYQEMKSSSLTSRVEEEESKIEKGMSKIEETFTKKESSSKEQSNESQNDEYEMPEASHTTTMKTFPTYVRYTNVNLEESKDFRELLKGFEEASSRVPNSRFKDRKPKSSQLNKAENNSPEDEHLVGKTYICNYMMEMRGGEMTDDHEDCACQIQLDSGVESNIVINDYENNQVHDRKDSIHEQLDVTIKEVNQTDDATRDGAPFVNMVKSSTGCQKDKAELTVRKKISGSNFPRKSWCSLS